MLQIKQIELEKVKDLDLQDWYDKEQVSVSVLEEKTEEGLDIFITAHELVGEYETAYGYRLLRDLKQEGVHGDSKGLWRGQKPYVIAHIVKPKTYDIELYHAGEYVAKFKLVDSSNMYSFPYENPYVLVNIEKGILTMLYHARIPFTQSIDITYPLKQKEKRFIKREIQGELNTRDIKEVKRESRRGYFKLSMRSRPLCVPYYQVRLQDDTFFMTIDPFNTIMPPVRIRYDKHNTFHRMLTDTDRHSEILLLTLTPDGFRLYY